MDKLEAQISALQDKTNSTASGLSELKATGAKREDVGDVRIKLGSVESQVVTLLSELERVRVKQETDQVKALEQSQEAIKTAEASGKPDYSLLVKGFSTLLTIIALAAGLNSWYINTTNQQLLQTITDLRAQLTIDNETLMGEINEAKAAASSAGKKHQGGDAQHLQYIEQLQAKVEELQGRVPSQSEWKTAEGEIDLIRTTQIEKLERLTKVEEAAKLIPLIQATQIEKLERLTRAEGLIDRSILLIEEEADARKVAVADVSEELIQQDTRLLAVSKKATNTAGTLKGVITEVEGQLRGIAVGTNTMIAGVRQNMAMVWPRVFEGDDMPENDYYGLDVLPAGALVILNDTNGD